MPEIGISVCTAEPLLSSAATNLAEFTREEKALLPAGNPFPFCILQHFEMEISQNQANLVDLPPKMEKVKFLHDNYVLPSAFTAQVLADNAQQPCLGPG